MYNRIYKYGPAGGLHQIIAMAVYQLLHQYGDHGNWRVREKLLRQWIIEALLQLSDILETREKENGCEE
jgi:hypothetical protein